MVLQDTGKAMQDSLSTLHMVTSNIEHENATMANVAQQTQKDSVTLKSLTRVATFYLPATLLAVSAPNGREQYSNARLLTILT